MSAPDAWCYSVIFPYASVSNFNPSGAPWGGTNSLQYKQINNPQADNRIWSLSRVYYDPNNQKAWFQWADAKKSWEIAIHNPTDTNYSAANGNLLKIYVHKDNGEIAESDAGGGISIKNQPVSPLSWNQNHFEVAVNAHQSVVVYSCWATGLPTLFNDPGSNCAFTGSIRIESSGDQKFSACLRGQQQGKTRLTDSTFSDHYTMMPFGYSGIDDRQYYPGQGAQNTAILPWFRERFNATTATASEWATQVFLTNMSPYGGVIRIRVFDESGSLAGSFSEIISAWAKKSFTPSQFYTSGSTTDVAGWIVIDNYDSQGGPTGKYSHVKPAAVAMQLSRFSGNWTIADFSKRLQSVVAAGSIVRFLRHRRSINPMSCRRA